jgi:antitoxin ChpS
MGGGAVSERVEWGLALRMFKARAEQALGERLAGLYVFGSRARGEAGPESDLDLAVILNDATFDRISEKLALSDIAYSVLLDTGAYIQPMPFSAEAWLSRSPISDLTAVARRDAIPLEAFS